MLTKNIILFTFFISTLNLMGQIIPTASNEIFEDAVNDFFDENANENYELSFFQINGLESVENERISIKWLLNNSFQQINYTPDENGKLNKWPVKTQTNFYGYFADSLNPKSKNGTEIKKIGSKLFISYYNNNVPLAEKVLTLDSKGKTSHQEHSYIDGLKKTTSFADFREIKLADNKVSKQVVYYKMIDGKKVIDYESESIFTTQVESKTKQIISVISKTRNKGAAETTSNVLFNKYFDSSGRLIKIEYPMFKKFMTIKYS